MDQGTDTRDNQHHRHREGIHPEIPGDIERSDLDPLGKWDHLRFPTPCPQGNPQKQGNQESQSGGGTCHTANGFFAQLMTKDHVDQ